MKVADICRIVEDFASLDKQESYDNSGLQVGNPEAEVSGVLICLDITESVIDEAIAKGCNMVLSHHPLLFRGLKQITGRTAVERVVIKALQHGVALYSGHTNVDSVRQGVSAKMCEKLGLRPLGFLSAKTEDAGLGMIGEFDQAISEDEFLALVKKTFACASLRHSAKTGSMIKRVALCGGSGAEFLSTAMAQKADAYLTADVKYHEFSAPEGRLLLVDAGHFETEQYTKEIFYDLLSKNIATFALQISQTEINPVCYF
ncbi:MAG: Nif3-like dinuclear metal center hexameric protein [Bacteroidales bacterium]|nr:Nif3-like dinuclear metal center hexameric protein [Bacteroidales bacterium]